MLDGFLFRRKMASSGYIVSLLGPLGSFILGNFSKTDKLLQNYLSYETNFIVVELNGKNFMICVYIEKWQTCEKSLVIFLPQNRFLNREPITR